LEHFLLSAALTAPGIPGTLRRMKKIHRADGERIAGRVENIGLASFLQLLEMERKTCSLHIAAAAGRQGRLFFRAGRLVGAETGELTGGEAALEIVTWEQADVEISSGSAVAGPPLPGGLAFLLMEAMRLKDEQGFAGDGDEDIDALLAAPTSATPATTAVAAMPDDLAEAVRDALATLLAETRTGAVIAAAVGARRVDLEAAAAAAAELAGKKDEVETKMGLLEALEEIHFTTARRSYLLRPLGSGEERFLLMILDRTVSDLADLAAARTALAEIAETLGDRVAV
jgi:hypothetical protein